MRLRSSIEALLSSSHLLSSVASAVNARAALDPPADWIVELGLAGERAD
jgi:hypothetical protein